MATLPSTTPRATPANVHGRGLPGAPARPLGALAAERRAARPDALRAKVEADPNIRDPEAFLVWLGRRKGGFRSHKGRSNRPGPGTRRLAEQQGRASGGRSAPQPAGGEETVRLSRRTLAAVQTDAPTMVLRRPAPPKIMAAKPSTAAAVQMAVAAGRYGKQATPVPKVEDETRPEPVNLPKNVAKLRAGGYGSRWKLGGRKSRKYLTEGI